MISKEKFIDAANSLHDSYADFARCLYAEAQDENMTDLIYDYMKTHASCSTDDVLMYLDNALGNTRPVVKITDEAS